jgi:hypothetical protein
MDKKELKDLTVPIFDKLKAAIEAGDKKTALALTDEINRNKHDFDESYRVWINLMLTYIADKLGEEALVEIHKTNCDLALWPRLGWCLDPKVSPEEKIRKIAYTWTNWHMSPIAEITEDDEKFVIKIKCDSGGSINQWPDHGKTKKAYPWAYNRKGLSYYCAHCSVLDIMSMERVGYPGWLCDPQPGGWCSNVLFKDQSKTPEWYYERVGLKKGKKKS